MQYGYLNDLFSFFVDLFDCFFLYICMPLMANLTHVFDWLIA